MKKENISEGSTGKSRGKKLALTCCIVALVCAAVIRPAVRAGAAAVHTIPHNNLEQVQNAQHLRLNRNTYSRHEWGSGLAAEGYVEDVDGTLTFSIRHPEDGNRRIMLNDVLDVYFENVGTIAGRALNAQIHVDSINGYHAVNGYNQNLASKGIVGFLTLTDDIPSCGSGSPFNTEIRLTITVTWADNGMPVDLPFYQAVIDIDAQCMTGDATYQESFEAVSGYDDDIYMYGANQTLINGMKIPTRTASSQEEMDSYYTIGDDSYLKSGIFISTSSGKATMQFVEGQDAGMGILLYSPFINLQPPAKSVS